MNESVEVESGCPFCHRTVILYTKFTPDGSIVETTCGHCGKPFIVEVNWESVCSVFVNIDRVEKLRQD